MADPYSLKWFTEKTAEAVIVVVIGYLAYVCGNGLLQAYLLPDRLEKAEAKMMKVFEERIEKAREAALNREADLMERLQKQEKEFADALVELKKLREAPALPPMPGTMPSLPPSPDGVDWKNMEKKRTIDPEKERLKYLQEQRFLNQQQQMPRQ
jgi:hypothetical protein